MIVIKCPHCGEKNRDDLKFCRMCGKPLKKPPETKSCPHCGYKNPADAKYCNSCGKSTKPSTKGSLNIKLLIGIIGIIVIVVFAGLFLLNGSSELDPLNSIPSFSSNNDTVDEIITSEDEEVKFKNVEFNGLFKMYVMEDSDFYEFPQPQYNSTYEWNDNHNYGSISFYRGIYYYDQYDDINDILTIFKDSGYDFKYNVEGNIIVFTPDNHYGETSFVGVVSEDNDFVLISGDDLDILKKSANTIVFN